MTVSWQGACLGCTTRAHSMPARDAGEVLQAQLDLPRHRLGDERELAQLALQLGGDDAPGAAALPPRQSSHKTTAASRPAMSFRCIAPPPFRLPAGCQTRQGPGVSPASPA